jgi:hypothetical protein
LFSSLLHPIALRFKLCAFKRPGDYARDDVRVFRGCDDVCYSYNDDDKSGDSACNVRARDNKHANDALAPSAGYVHRDGEVMGPRVADLMQQLN